jgi:hypothetical protein
MKVFINNESDAILNLAGEELAHGDYTPGWHPPAVIAAGEQKGFQGEGNIIPVDVPSTGTEGRVRYNISGGGELYIHWDSPLVESQYGNTFHIFAPPGWEVSHSGGQGHDAELRIRLRRTVRRAVRNFNPRGRGFAFVNHWDHSLPVVSIGFLWHKIFSSHSDVLSQLHINDILDENWLPLTHADAGLCGGMVYAIMDYFAARLLPPMQPDAPSNANDPVFKHIRDRLVDSFDILGQGHRWLGYSAPTYPNGDEGVIQALGLARGRSWVTYREEFPLVKEDIEAGRLSPLSLVQTDNLDVGKNHQVLAYGYMQSGQDVTLYIYNPNSGQQEVTFQFNITATDGEVHITRSDGGPRIFCFFRTNGYEPKQPPSGRRVNSVGEALRAATDQNAAYSVRRAVAGSPAGSVLNWLRSV